TATSAAALESFSVSDTIRVLSSIVANPTIGANCGGVGPITDLGANLQWPTTTGCPLGFVLADPTLGPLAANGGVSQTMAITSAVSLAVNTGNCGIAPTDQRGFPRVGACDKGAYEFGSTLADAAPPVCNIA